MGERAAALLLAAAAAMSSEDDISAGMGWPSETERRCTFPETVPEPKEA